jgi:hypothetical protein
MSSIPPITQKLTEQARLNPGGWVYAIDPEYDPRGQVPPYGVVGAWKVDDFGQLAEFLENPSYRPSAAALEWREPATQLEQVLQLVATGRLPDAKLVELFLTERVWIYGGHEGSVYVAPSESGGRVIGAFTDEGLIPAGEQTSPEQLVGRQLVEMLPDDVSIVVNPGHVPCARLDLDQLRSALDAMA